MDAPADAAQRFDALHADGALTGVSAAAAPLVLAAAEAAGNQTRRRSASGGTTGRTVALAGSAVVIES